jgi:phosphoribosylamine--glycine ligase
MLVERSFGVAGSEVLVEEFMAGEELSMFAVTNGEWIVPLPAAQDHKRLLEGDRGPNTGGMGAYAPVSLLSADAESAIVDEIFRPALDALRSRGTPFTGLLYAGLMLTADGPKVVEFNCRFGDPETQAVLPVFPATESLLELLLAASRNAAAPPTSLVRRAEGHAVTTVLASSGYPESPRYGDALTLPPTPEGTLVFHAGTKRRADGTLVTAGGRVLAVTGVGTSFDEAQRRSREYATRVEFHGRQFRSDIGWREIARLTAGHAGAA